MVCIKIVSNIEGLMGILIEKEQNAFYSLNI